MKLRVQHESGLMETLTLVPPCVVRLGRRLNSIHDSTGAEYWFTEDGHYDGWSCELPGTSDQEANQVIARIEAAREFD